MEVVSAFGFGELIEEAAAKLPEFVDGAFGTVAQQLLKFRGASRDLVADVIPTPGIIFAAAGVPTCKRSFALDRC